MDARTIGMTARVDDVDIGKCIIFNVSSTAQIGIVVSLNQLEKGILHLDAMRDGVTVPTIYEMHHFYNEKCIVINSARIVPVLAAEHVGFGRFSRPASQALYITDEGVLISALKGNSVLPINLLTGRPDYMDSFNSVYTKAWYIEVVDVDGSYEPYHEFRCEPAT